MTGHEGERETALSAEELCLVQPLVTVLDDHSPGQVESVARAQEPARQVHQMELSREQALAMAKPA